MTGGGSFVIREAVGFGCLNCRSMATGTIPLDLVMLFVTAATGRNAVDDSHRYRRDMTSDTGKLMPLVIEPDGPGSRRSSRRSYRYFDLVGRGHFLPFVAGRTVAA